MTVPALSGVSLAPEPIDGAAAARLLDAYQAEVEARCGPLAVCLGGNDPAEYAPGRGAFLVVRDADGTPLGCGGVRSLPSGDAELKRMYITPAARGRGVGRRLLLALEAVAADLGCPVVRLDSRSGLTEALAMYRSAGYRETAPYNDNPDAQVWMERRLG